MNFQRTILSNGLRVLAIPMPSFKSATVLMMVGAGSRYETKDNNGISHFLEHMAFKGTEKRPSARLIATLIDGIGGEFNAFTSKETTGFYIKSSVNHVDLSLDVLSDMLLNSLFKAEEIEKERGVILEEINLYEDTPVRKIGDVYERLLYGDTPMGWDIAGEKEVIRKIQREDFLDYMSSFYSANNMTVVIAGGINPQDAFEKVEKYFGRMKKFDTKSYIKVVENQDKPKVMVKHKKTEQVHIALGVRTVSLNHPHRYPLSVISAILGGGMSSRLFHEVREKRGLAYYVRSLADHYHDTGSLVSLSGVDPKRVEEAIKVIIEEYGKVSCGAGSRSARQNSKFPTSSRSAGLRGAGRIQNSELKKAKELLKGHMILELEDSRSVAGFYAAQELLEKKIDNPEEVIAKIDKVTVQELEEVTSQYFVNSNLNLAVIGNFPDGQMFEKLLTL